MAYKVVFSSKAKIDILDAYEYYSFRSLQAVKKIDAELENAVKALTVNPHFRIRYQNIIGFPLKKFPFILLYTLDDATKTVLIYSVFNTYLSPKKYPRK